MKWLVWLPLLAACPQKYEQPRVETPDSWPDPASANNALGVDGPIEVLGVARDGRWAILCQAREDTTGDGEIERDDDMSPAIVVRSGAGVGFDHLLDVSTDQRWVAVARGVTYSLVDTRAPSITDVGTASGAQRFAGAAAFTADGTRLLRADGHELIVRDLGSGEEQRIDLGARIGWIDADAAGAWARVELDARVRLWIQDADLPGGCSSPWTAPDDWTATPGEIVWVDVLSGEILRGDPTLIRPVGAHRLHRTDTGVTLDGNALGGQWCATAKAAAVLPEPLTALLVCVHGEERLHLATADGDTTLAPSLGQGFSEPSPPPLVDAPVCVRGSGDTSYCTDLAGGTVASADGELVLQHERSALFLDGSEIVAVDLLTGTSRAIGGVTDGVITTRSGSVLVVDGKAFDAVTAQILNEGPPDAVVGGDGRGHLLVATPRGERMPRGPLRWKLPDRVEP